MNIEFTEAELKVIEDGLILSLTQYAIRDCVHEMPIKDRLALMEKVLKIRGEVSLTHEGWNNFGLDSLSIRLGEKPLSLEYAIAWETGKVMKWDGENYVYAFDMPQYFVDRMTEHEKLMRSWKDIL